MPAKPSFLHEQIQKSRAAQRNKPLPEHVRIAPEPKAKEKGGQFYLPLIGGYLDTNGIERPNLNTLAKNHPLWDKLKGTQVFRKFNKHATTQFKRKFAQMAKEKEKAQEEQVQPKKPPQRRRKVLPAGGANPGRTFEAQSEPDPDMPQLEPDPTTASENLPKVKKEKNIVVPPKKEIKEELVKSAGKEETFCLETVESTLSEIDDILEKVAKDFEEGDCFMDIKDARVLLKQIKPVYRKIEEGVIGKKDQMYIKAMEISMKSLLTFKLIRRTTKTTT